MSRQSAPTKDYGFIFAPEVADAIATGRPIVAFESTILTHGMPYPQNLEMAQGVEDIARDEGVTPATIAVIDGGICIGLTAEQLAKLAQTKNAQKLSRADLAFAVSEGMNGGTTVAATMMLAERAGISVFATGGIGGVHRGAEASFDISADLDEFAKSAVIVVAAVAKAILDIPKTLEVLETKGVPVITYQSDKFPAFWSRNSGEDSPLRLDSPAAIARFQETRQALDIAGGMLVANPIPASDEIPRDAMNRYIANALAAAEEKGITGKAVTPFLLETLFTLTDGASLTANIALVRNNARLACKIARALNAR